MQLEIQQFVSQCIMCDQVHASINAPIILLQSWGFDSNGTWILLGCEA
jgi:hypothetical protein